MRRFWVAAGVAAALTATLAAVVAAGVAGLSSYGERGAGPVVAKVAAHAVHAPSFPPPTFTMRGNFIVGAAYFSCPGCEDSGGLSVQGATCWTIGALRNVRDATGVRVTGPDGSLLGLGRLEEPRVAADPAQPSVPQWCVYAFTVPEVPEGLRFYTVTVGGINGVEFREDEVNPGPVQVQYG